MFFTGSKSFKKKLFVAFIFLIFTAGIYLLREIFPVILLPVEKLMFSLIDFPKHIISCMYGEDKIKKENKNLHLQLQRLKLEMDKFEYLKRENEILRKYLMFKTDYGIGKFVIGRVMGFSGNNWINSFRIDVGYNDGVKRGDLVVYDGVLIGIVDVVYPKSSIVLTVGDKNFRITVRTRKTGELCLYQGFDEKTGYLKYVRPEQDIRVGDTVITEAVSENIPAGIPVGIIKHISQKEGEFFRSVEVSLFYKQTVLDYVMVVSR